MLVRHLQNFDTQTCIEQTPMRKVALIHMETENRYRRPTFGQSKIQALSLVQNTQTGARHARSIALKMVKP